MTTGTHRTDSADRAATRWATLEPEALQDEIDQNARHERRVLLVALVAALITGAALLARTLLG